MAESDKFLQVGDKKYNTINKAVTEAQETGKEIRLISDATTTSQGIIPEGTEITLDTQGYTLRITKTLKNNGNLIIKNSNNEQKGTIINTTSSRDEYTIESVGDISLNNVTISGQNGVYANSNISVTNSNIDVNNRVIYSKKNLDLNSSTLKNSNGYSIIEIQGGSATINGGVINSTTTNSTGILNNGELTITDVEMYGEGIGINIGSGSTTTIETANIHDVGKCIYAYSYTGTAKVTINDGIYQATGNAISIERFYNYPTVNMEINGGTYSGTIGINYTGIGTVNINKATVTGTNYGILISAFGTYPTLNIKGEEVNVTGNNTGIYSDYGGYINIDKGNITGGTNGIYLYRRGYLKVYGGSIKGGTYGIRQKQENSDKIEIGKDDGEIDQTTPKIIGDSYGIYNEAGDINYYDGILEGKVGTYNTTITNIPEGYSIKEDIDGEYIINYLETKNVVAKINEKSYTNLESAINDSNSGDIINMINNDSEFTEITIPSDKDIVINTNGNIINCSKGITNNGKLTINNDNTEKGTLKTSGSASIINNNGTLIVQNNILSSNVSNEYTIINQENKNMKIENSEISGQNGIKNLSNMTLTNTDVSATKDYAIYNSNNNQYQINITSGNITGNIYSNGSTKDEITITDIIQNGIVANNNTKMNLENYNITFDNIDKYDIVYAVANTGGTLSIKDTTIDITNNFDTKDGWSYKSLLYGIYNKNLGTLKISNSSISGKTIKNNSSSSAHIGGIYLDNTAGITNVDIDGYTTSLDSYKEAYGIYVSGAENDSSINIKNANININTANTGYGIYETSTSNDFNVNLISGNIYTNATTAYGVYVDSGSLTMGIKDGDGSENATVDKENPFVKAVGTTGVGVKKNNGYFKYYDGKIMGSTNAKPDTTTDTEYNYEAVMHTDQETGYEYCVLEYMK